MERIKLTADTPSYVKVWEIEKDLLDFNSTLNEKYSTIDFIFWFCFRALLDDAISSGWKSKVVFYKKDNALGFDIIMPEKEFVQQNMAIQRRIMGKHFFLFFTENIHKYRYKLPVLKSIEKDLVEDMRLLLVDNLWLPIENGQYKLSVIETVTYERAIRLFGNPKEKRFKDNAQGIKVQDLTWVIDEVENELSATYLLIDKKWQLQKYEVRIK